MAICKVYSLIKIYVDNDGCPVKDEAYRVARTDGLKVYLVSYLPPIRGLVEELFELVIVKGQF